MYYLRTFKSGEGVGKSDPREKKWAEFKCACCDNLHQIDITRIKDFDFGIERKCPHCGKLNPDDRKKSIQAEIDKLTEERRRIDVMIEQKIKELDSDHKVEYDRNVFR